MNATVNNIDSEILFDKYNCRIIDQTEDFLIVMPLDLKCAKFIKSAKCGCIETTWCIGKKNLWDMYILEENVFYLIYFKNTNSVWGKKLIIQYNRQYRYFTAWDEKNRENDYILHTYKNMKKIYRKRKNNKFTSWDFDVFVWYCLLLHENKISKQGFFDFDIFENIKIEDIRKNKFGSLFYSFILILCDTIYLQYKELPVICKTPLHVTLDLLCQKIVEMKEKYGTGNSDYHNACNELFVFIESNYNLSNQRTKRGINIKLARLEIKKKIFLPLAPHDRPT